MARHRSSVRDNPLAVLPPGDARRGAVAAAAAPARHRRPSRSAHRVVLAAATGGGLLAVVGTVGTATSATPMSAVNAAMTVGSTPATSSSERPAAPIPTAPAAPPQTSALVDGALLVKQAVLAQSQALQQVSADVKALSRAQAERARAQHEQADRSAAPPVPRRGPDSPAPTTTATAGCGIPTGGLGPVKPWVRAGAQFLGCRFGEPTMFGVAGRSGASDHPAGLAVDFMVDRATGDRLAACALKNADALNVKYVIWRQRINTGDGWESMEDRGSVTANHMDHVHISFTSTASAASAIAC